MARKRRGKSSISRLPPEQREYIERLLREGRLTLDEIIAELQERFQGAPAAQISRSSLHRYERGFAELTGRMREFREMADAVVGELGEGIGDKAGSLLAQAITTLAANATLRAHEADDISIEEIRKLAVAAKHAMDAQRIDLNLRKQIESEARAQVLSEQRKKLEALGKSGAIDAAALSAVIKAAYDL